MSTSCPSAKGPRTTLLALRPSTTVTSTRQAPLGPWQRACKAMPCACNCCAMRDNAACPARSCWQLPADWPRQSPSPSSIGSVNGCMAAKPRCQQPGHEPALPALPAGARSAGCAREISTLCGGVDIGFLLVSAFQGGHGEKVLSDGPPPPKRMPRTAVGRGRQREKRGRRALHSSAMEIWMHQLLHLAGLPQFGLSTVFVVSFISATLLPLGSEPAVFGLVKLNPESFLARDWCGHRGQHPGRCGELVDGPWGPTRPWTAPGAAPTEVRAALGRSRRFAPRRLPAELAARCGRPAVRRGRLAQAAVSGPAWPYMAVGKFFPLPGHDEARRLGFMPGQVGRLRARTQVSSFGAATRSQSTGWVASQITVSANSSGARGSQVGAHCESSTATSASDASSALAALARLHALAQHCQRRFKRQNAARHLQRLRQRNELGSRGRVQEGRHRPAPGSPPSAPAWPACASRSWVCREAWGYRCRLH